MLTTRLSDRIDADRLWRRHMELAKFGALPGGGVNRQALSAEEIAARAELIGWGRAIGLAPFTDAAANLFLRLEGQEPTLPPVLIGSHIDSQPTGGKFDGAFGVLAAFEVAEALAASGRRPRRAVEVVAWMNEEGSRFAPGMMGSAVYSGQRKLEDVLEVRDKAGITVEAAARELLARDQDVPHRAFGRPVAAFVEAHIEQGPLLEREGKVIGVATGIQGKRTYRVVIEGEEAHAGTSTRAERRDALVSTVAVIDALQKAMWDAADETRFTIGMLNITPNAPSVVPGRAEFSIDLRQHDGAILDRHGAAIEGVCKGAAGRCTASVRQLLHDAPLTFPADMRRRIGEAAGALGIPWREMPSPAGHDSRYLHTVCPTGMIFIPCRGGLSHNEAEWAEPTHIAAGARVLADVVEALAAG